MSAVAESAARVKVHVSLNVADVERSVKFYEAFFGAPAHKRRPGYANFDLEHPALKLALQERGSGHGAGSVNESLDNSPIGPLNHLGLQVASAAQVNAARERLIAAGLATFDEGDTICCYARQDKVWAHDPDGNGWEVYVLLDDMLEEDAHDVDSAEVGRVTADSVCCADPAKACCAG